MEEILVEGFNLFISFFPALIWLEPYIMSQWYEITFYLVQGQYVLYTTTGGSSETAVTITLACSGRTASAVGTAARPLLCLAPRFSSPGPDQVVLCPGTDVCEISHRSKPGSPSSKEPSCLGMTSIEIEYEILLLANKRKRTAQCRWFLLQEHPLHLTLLTCSSIAWWDVVFARCWLGRPAIPLKNEPGLRCHQHLNTTQHHIILISLLPEWTLLSCSIAHTWLQPLKQQHQSMQSTTHSHTIRAGICGCKPFSYFPPKHREYRQGWSSLLHPRVLCCNNTAAGSRTATFSDL